MTRANGNPYTMPAFETTIKIRLRPEVIGPEAGTEWKSEASASDFISSVLSEAAMDTILDWGYLNPDNAWTVVETPDDYEEGEMFA